MNDNLTCCLDWISFTFPVSYTLPDVIEFLGFDIREFQYLDGGASGYSRRCRHNLYNIWILWQGNNDMGVHVDCSGSAVNALVDSVVKDYVTTPFGDGYVLEDFNISVLQQFFIKLIPVVKFSRIDLAIDDTTGLYYSLTELHQVGLDLSYISLFKQWKETFSKSTDDGNLLGYTVYLGSRTSDLFVRIYDKRLEQISKGVDVPYSSWVRWEMEIKHDNAQSVAEKISTYQEFNQLVFDLLNRYIRIVDLTTSNRKRRCKNAKKWDDFIGAVNRIRLTRNKSDYDIIEKKRNWLMESCGKSLSLVLASDGGDEQLIYDMLKYGRSKFTSSDIDIINSKLHA